MSAVPSPSVGTAAGRDGWSRKDLLAIEALSSEEIALILDRAESIRGTGPRHAGVAAVASPTGASPTGGSTTTGPNQAAPPPSGGSYSPTNGPTNGSGEGSRRTGGEGSGSRSDLSPPAASPAALPTGDALAGRTVARLFFPPGDAVAADPQAATSWDLAARRRGAETLEVTTGPASGDDGGALASALDLDALGVDLLLVGHPHAGVPAAVARRVRAGVVNAGDGAHEDPAAALALGRTLRRRLGSLEGHRVALVGDFLHSAVARSLAHLLMKLGAEVAVGGLHALVPVAVESLGVRHAPTPDEAMEGAQAVVVLPPAPAARDGRTYPSPREYHRVAGLTAERLARAADGVAVLHARPVTRGLEIAAEVADGPASALAEQNADALAVRMAVLGLLAEAAAGGGE